MGIFSSSKKKNKKKLANAQADATGASFAYHRNTTALVIKYNLQYFPMSILRRSPMNLLDLPYLLIKWVLFFILSILEIPYNIVMRIISPVLRPINRFVIAPLMAVYFWVVFFPISFLIRVTQIPRIIGLLLGNVVGRTLWRIITFPVPVPADQLDYRPPPASQPDAVPPGAPAGVLQPRDDERQEGQEDASKKR